MLEPGPPPTLRIAGKILWLDGLAAEPVRLLPSSPHWRKRRCYWALRSGRLTTAWCLSPALAIAAFHRLSPPKQPEVPSSHTG